MAFNIENDHNPDKVVVYGTMIVFPGYKQVVGRIDVIHNGKKYTLESHTPPFIEKKGGKWYKEGELVKME